MEHSVFLRIMTAVMIFWMAALSPHAMAWGPADAHDLTRFIRAKGKIRDVRSAIQHMEEISDDLGRDADLAFFRSLEESVDNIADGAFQWLGSGAEEEDIPEMEEMAGELRECAEKLEDAVTRAEHFENLPADELARAEVEKLARLSRRIKTWLDSAPRKTARDARVAEIFRQRYSRFRQTIRALRGDADFRQRYCMKMRNEIREARNGLRDGAETMQSMAGMLDRWIEKIQDKEAELEAARVEEERRRQRIIVAPAVPVYPSVPQQQGGYRMYHSF